MTSTSNGHTGGDPCDVSDRTGGVNSSLLSTSAHSVNSVNNPSLPKRNWMENWPPEALSMARAALEMTRRDWRFTGLKDPDSDFVNSSSNSNSGDGYSNNNDGGNGGEDDAAVREEIAEGVVALLLIRIVALATSRLGNVTAILPPAVAETEVARDVAQTGGGQSPSSGGGSPKVGGIAVSITSGGNKKSRKKKLYLDYSTATICKTALGLLGESNAGGGGQGREGRRGSENSDYNGSFASRNNSNSSGEDTQGGGSHASGGGGGTEGAAGQAPPACPFPASITPAVISQLRRYVRSICNGYRSVKDVPYHNVEHAYHVFLSANKLLDLMLCETLEVQSAERTNKALLRNLEQQTSPLVTEAIPNGGAEQQQQYITVAGRRRRRGRRSTVDSAASSGTSGSGQSQRAPGEPSLKQLRERAVASVGAYKKRKRPTYGIKSDPLAQLAFLFSALVHDVDHTGISNRQLVLEMDDLAILYNDQSVAEQRSLAVAFTTLKGEGYDELREVLFPRTCPISPRGGGGEGGGGGGGTQPPAANEDFFKFRKLVIDLVLVTDIASPERTQIVKSKWKEAFGDVIVAEKMRKSGSNSTGRKSSAGSSGMGGNGGPKAAANSTRGRTNTNRRASTESKSSMVSFAEDDAEGKNSAMVDKDNAITLSTKTGDGGMRGRFALARDSSQRSIGTTSSNGLNLRSSLLSTLSADCNSIINSIRQDDMDSIEFSEDSSIMSDMQSLDDDFNASAVSRTKMNLDNMDSFNTISDSSKNDSDRKQQTEKRPSSAYANSKGAVGVSSGGGHPRDRWSTSDLCDISVDGGPLDDTGHSLEKPSNESFDLVPTSSEERKQHARSFHAAQIIVPVNPNATPATKTAPVRQTQSLTIPQQLSRRKPVGARSGRPKHLTQSTLTHSEFLRVRPRALSQERRLGVRRALDLAGSTVMAYSGTLRGSASSNSTGPKGDVDSSDLIDGPDPDDDEDEFKAMVVLEQLIRAADVAALIQDFENSIKWSTRLYKELRNGFLQNRGEDPSVDWYENQIKFWDFYILPLAKNLGVMGVFEDCGLSCVSWSPRGGSEGTVTESGRSSSGGSSYFVSCVKSNMARWIEEGTRITELMMKNDEAERKRERENSKMRQSQKRREQQQAEEDQERMKEEETDTAQEMNTSFASLNIQLSSSDHVQLGNLPPVSSLGLSSSFTGQTKGGLNSSFTSASSAHSNLTPTSADGNKADSKPRKKRSAKRLLVHSKSMEVGKPCDICGVVGRYSCPVCAAPYCSVNCCKEHKALCKGT